MKIFIFLLFQISLAAQAMIITNDAIYYAVSKGCSLAFALQSEDMAIDEVSSEILCFNDRLSDAGTYKELRGCSLNLMNVNENKELRLEWPAARLSTANIQIEQSCSAPSIRYLFGLPINEKLKVKDLANHLFPRSTRSRWIVLLDQVGFASELENIKPASSSFAYLPISPINPLSDDSRQSRSAEQFQQPVVKVFFGTDRAVRGHSNKLVVTGFRNESGNLTYGTADVSIPLNHQTGVIEAPSILSFELTLNPQKHMSIKKIRQAEGSEFFRQLKSRVNKSAKKDLFVFIHGFNMTFEDAALRTAQLAYDLKFAGAPVMFTWPSEGQIWRYTVDEANVEWSFRHFAKFLKDVVGQAEARTVHLIAHSMGNRALSNAISLLMDKKEISEKVFQQVILAAPDVDLGTFAQLADAMKSAAKQVTIYANENDLAVTASEYLHRYARLGTENFIYPGIETIDATKIKTAWWDINHSYFGEQLPLLEDIKALLDFSLPAKQRKNLLEKSTVRGRYWEFLP
jgi:esterase/lipase superfamily enzyme